MYHPTSRVLAVLELLQSHKRMSGAELAQRLEVNIRTLRRYITILQDIGIPIHAERGRYGAYILGVGFRLPPMMFTNDEAVALEIGLLVADQLSLVGQGVAVESARAKLEHVMPYELQSQVRALNDSIQLELNINATSTSTNLMLIIGQAIQNSRSVLIRYHTSANQGSERLIDPYSIVCRKGLWYVVGWCHLREDLRSFRLDRIPKADLSDSRFQAPANFDALSHIEQSIATLHRQFTFEVLLKSDIITVKAAVFNVFGVLEFHPDGILLQGSADDLDWVARQLMALPFDFVIHSPNELSQALHKRATELLGIASTTSIARQ